MSQSIKLKIQNFGQFLSSIMMPNISIFIVLGIMNAWLLPLSYQTDQTIERLISTIILYLLPIRIGYTSGKLIGNERGGIVGSICTIGLIISTNTSVLLGAIISGILGGWAVKNFDNLIKNKIKNGFEMLVNNFSISIIGIFLTIFSFLFISPFIEFISIYTTDFLKIIIHHNLLPMIAIIIEPAKVYFLNNAINHGIFSPLGLQDVLEHKNSIFFLIESNPGPGLGLLLAYFIVGQNKNYKSIGSAAIIHFFGGVHEVYFSYVLMNPKLLLSLILGSMTSIFILVCFKGGLIGAVSPGSILSILAMTKKDFYYINIFSILSSSLVSFLISIILLKFINIKNQKFIKLSKSINISTLLNHQSDNFFENINTIVVACDAGMGSSAVGSSILREKIKKTNLTNISIFNSSIRCIPKNADMVITHKNLTDRAIKYAPDIKHLSLVNFIDNIFYESLVNKLVENQKCSNKNHINKSNNYNQKNKLEKLFQLRENNIFLNQFADNKEEAIQIVGKYLVKQGYVKKSYINAMLEREKIASTWLGESIALPHGTIEAKDDILKTGVIFCQFPNGVHFGDNLNDIAYLVIGIAAKNNEHIHVVSQITQALDDEKIIARLSTTKDIKEVLSYLKV